MADKKTNKRHPEHGEIFFSWKFNEFDHHERSSRWYMWAAIALGALLVYSFLSSNFLFGMIIVISSLTMILLRRNNKEVEFSIMEDGISIDDKFHEYNSLQNFFIIYQPPEVKTLYFEPKSVFSLRIPVNLTDQDPSAVRKVLREYLEEDLDQENEPLSDQVSRFFKL